MTRPLVLVCALASIACASRPPRLTAPLNEGPVPSAAESPLRTTPPDPRADEPLPHFEPAVSTLSNGMKLVVVERHGHGTVAANLAFARDVVDVGDLGGVRLSLLPFVYFQATDASDDASVTCGTNGCLFGVRDAGDGVEDALERIAELALRPKGSREDQTRRLSVALATLAKQRGAAVANNVQEALFRGTYYGLHEPRVPDVPLDVLDRVREAVVTPSAATLVVAGEVTPERARAAAEAAFGAWKPPANTIRPRPEPPRTIGGPHVILVPTKREQMAGLVFVRGPALRDPDAYAVRVAANALGNGRASRAFSQVREELGAAYAVGAQIFSFRDTSAIVVGGSFEAEKSIDGLVVLLDGVRDLRDNLLAPKALAAAKTRAIADWRAQVSTDHGLASALASDALVGLPLDLDALPKAVDAVSSDDVRRAARAWFSESDIHLLILGDVRAIFRRLSELGLKDYNVRDFFARTTY